VRDPELAGDSYVSFAVTDQLLDGISLFSGEFCSRIPGALVVPAAPPPLPDHILHVVFSGPREQMVRVRAFAVVAAMTDVQANGVMPVV
jgi:hypothetical protein